MVSREVLDRNEVFDEWNEHQDLNFREYTEDEYVALAMGNGVTGWPGGFRDVYLYSGGD